MGITILHLTDIHLGPGEIRDEDQKTHVSGVERARIIDRLKTYIEALPRMPDYVVVTGDLTIHGNVDGLREAKDWLVRMISKGSLPDSSRFLIVPGNHDVKWGCEEKKDWHRDRYGLFFDIIGKAFPHAYLPHCDPPLDWQSPPTFGGSKGFSGGLATDMRNGEVAITSSHPFLLDLEKDLLLFAFNSTLACGVYVKDSDSIITSLEHVIDTLKPANTPIVSKLEDIKTRYKAGLIVDAGLVGDEQLEYFSSLMSRLRDQLEDRFARLTKVAILHHHVAHLWRQQLEVKQFESVVDAAQLKRRLVEYGFDIVLHGHKHTNHVSLDSSIIPISRREEYRPLCIVSGGTICGFPRLGETQTFKLVTFAEDSGPRSTGWIRQVPLDDTGDPRSVINDVRTSPLYSIPISSRLPVLHDDEILKEQCDAYLRDKLAPELKHSRGKFTDGEEFDLPVADPTLVNDDKHYLVSLVVELKKETRFYDIIIATDRLRFQYRARIYWMLRDVKAYATAQNRTCRVILLVGNLEQTHYFVGESRGKVGESIEMVKQWFQPAMESGLLDVREHRFTQREIDAIASSAHEVGAPGRT